MPQEPDDRHRRPDDVDDLTVQAAGRVREYVEWVIRARGRLYDFHQMVGHADAVLGEAVELLTRAGHRDLADGLRTDLLGRNAIPGHWTFEIVEAFDDTYWARTEAWDRRVRDELMDGRPHVQEAEMKAARRTDGPTDDT